LLDFGCGPGTFIPIFASLCAEVKGIDVVPAFVEKANAIIKEKSIANAEACLLSDFSESVYENYFDYVLMIDVLHHMESPETGIAQAYRFLRPGGKLLILEQNRLNPLTFIVHLLDPNERKVIKIGSFKYYRKILADYFTIEEESYNPAILGGYSSIATRIMADFLNTIVPLHWLLPRLSLVCRDKKPLPPCYCNVPVH